MPSRDMGIYAGKGHLWRQVFKSRPIVEQMAEEDVPLTADAVDEPDHQLPGGA